MHRLILAAVLAATLLVVPSAQASVKADDAYGVANVKKDGSTVKFDILTRLQHIKGCSGKVRVSTELPDGKVKSWRGNIVDRPLTCLAIIPASLPSKYFRKTLTFRFAHDGSKAFKAFGAKRKLKLSPSSARPQGYVRTGPWNYEILNAAETEGIASIKFNLQSDYTIDASSFQFAPFTLPVNCGPGYTSVPVAFAISGSAPMLGQEGNIIFGSSSVTPHLNWIISYKFQPPFNRRTGFGGLTAVGLLELGGALRSCSGSWPADLQWLGS